MKGWSAGLVTGIGLCLGSWMWLWNVTQASVSSETPEKREGVGASFTPAPEVIWVDVSGAVAVPGVYKLHTGQLVSEALAQAGGLVAVTDYQYLHQKLNLAEEVKSGQKIYVPFIEERRAEAESSAKKDQDTPNLQSSASTLISINLATASQLQSLPAIGEKRAADIIAGRPYSTIDELVTKQVLPEGIFSNLKTQLSL